MFTFLKKDVLVLLRDRSELIVLLLMPVILTLILGFALKGLFAENGTGLDIQVAVVNENDKDKGLELFLEDVAEMQLPEDAMLAMEEAAHATEPHAMLDEIFSHEELQEVVELTYMEKSAADEALEKEEIVAILTVPADFTYDSLTKMLLDEGHGSQLELIEGTHAPLSAGVFHDIIASFVQTMNTETAIAKATERQDVAAQVASSIDPTKLGSKVSVTDQEPVTSMEYYAIGIAAMFALFTASTIASKAYVENFQLVYDRILLSGKHPWLYLSGKAISTAVITMMQIIILFIMARVVMQAFADNSIEFWLGVGVIGLVFSICVGALGALLTAITVKYKSNSIPTIFSGGIVSIFALLGGSFVPVSNMPDMIGTLGNWTPNGIMLDALLQWAQGLGTDFVGPLMLKLLLLTGLIFLVSLAFFAKRRVA